MGNLLAKGIYKKGNELFIDESKKLDITWCNEEEFQVVLHGRKLPTFRS